MKGTILIVEDNLEIAEIEKDYLENAGYRVVIAIDGEEALTLFKQQEINLVILDLNLPQIDGIEVCKRLRNDSGVPIIMVTAKTKEIDELLGLEVGADDYVKKPFSPKILVSRVKALLQRPHLNSATKISYGTLELDIEKRKLLKKGREVPITTIQFNILLQLMQSPGRVFERYELIDKSYLNGDLPDIFDRTMDSHIKNIRKLIEDDSKNPKYILTVRGVGYKFNENL